ncbi:hypothetical protein GCM10022279_08730 [Comamonas faecalis]|uniref:Shikimate kinase n=1 Tax=Comamonas faecalis TaxID=1387849 RepID=A0ABP7QTU9_9BURK
MTAPADAGAAAPLRIALVGMPGSGKSTVGRHLARRLRLPFADLDQLLEQQLGTSIRQHFETHGEQDFRDREAALLADLARAGGPLVLSTGGGAVLREANRQALRAGFDPVIYLRASADEIFRRIRHDRSRPLLQVSDPLDQLRQLHRVRDPLYREVAHHAVEARRPSVQRLVQLVVAQLELSGRCPALADNEPPAEDPGTAQPPLVRLLRIHGKVQGVGFRQSTVEVAQGLGLRGWVRNRRDGSVEVLASGAEIDVQALITWAHGGPPAARVERVEVQPALLQAGDALPGFEQRQTL